MPNETTVPLFRTPDLNVAAFLIIRGHELVRLEPTPDWRKTFVFPQQAEEDARAFYSGAGVRAFEYASALRSLKAMIRQSI
jgi:hypothetical protein